MILAGLQCSKRCQFNNCFVFFCHGEQSNSHETFPKAYTVNIMLFPNPVGKIAITSLPRNKCWIDILCSHFKINNSMISQYIFKFFCQCLPSFNHNKFKNTQESRCNFISLDQDHSVKMQRPKLALIVPIF